MRGFIAEPRIIQKAEMIIAGVRGDGNKTGDLWEKFTEKDNKIGLRNKSSNYCYEVRIYSDDSCDCHVSMAVSTVDGNDQFDLLTLPPSEYAVFEVFVAAGYNSQNGAMDQWIVNIPVGYLQSKLQGKPFIVEYYDERFKGNEPDSVIEMWVPIAKP